MGSQTLAEGAFILKVLKQEVIWVYSFTILDLLAIKLSFYGEVQKSLAVSIGKSPFRLGGELFGHVLMSLHESEYVVVVLFTSLLFYVLLPLYIYYLGFLCLYIAA